MIALSIASKRPGLILARVHEGLGASRASWAALEIVEQGGELGLVEPAQRPSASTAR